jgi:hypothetical protein
MHTCKPDPFHTLWPFVGFLEDLRDKCGSLLWLVSLKERAGVYKIRHQLSLFSFFNNPSGKRNAYTRQAVLNVLKRNICMALLLQMAMKLCAYTGLTSSLCKGFWHYLIPPL